MEALNSINIESQIEDCLFGESENTTNAVNKKIEQTANNISNVIKINGAKVFNVITDNECLYYNLRDTNKKQKYYYPIKYANIEFK